jgi:HCOMODA/2-hydroxy-3-carboxy-muconic semialdehyde decarboxylase
VPAFEIRNYAGDSDMRIANAKLGKALADVLGDNSVVRMRGHGDVVVGPSVEIATLRAIYTDINARLQAQAIALGGPVTYLSKQEGGKTDAILQKLVMALGAVEEEGVRQLEEPRTARGASVAMRACVQT